MNTNKIIKLLPLGIVLAGMAFLALVKDTATYLPALAAIVSYAAVAGMVAIASVDYRDRRL
jgi:hypothetical protein